MEKLSSTKSGQKGVIKNIDGDARFLSRITSIGLTIGSEVEIIQNVKRYPILVYGRDTMIALNRKECEKITLEVIR